MVSRSHRGAGHLVVTYQHNASTNRGASDKRADCKASPCAHDQKSRADRSIAPRADVLDHVRHDKSTRHPFEWRRSGAARRQGGERRVAAALETGSFGPCCPGDRHRNRGSNPGRESRRTDPRRSHSERWNVRWNRSECAAARVGSDTPDGSVSRPYSGPPSMSKSYRETRRAGRDPNGRVRS